MEIGKLFSKSGPVANRLAGYEQREGQKVMALEVSSALGLGDGEEVSRASGILVIEAETGIGKTLAYLVPAALSGKRVVVSTATLNLQDQILEKDIPAVEKIIGEDIGAVCIKGRENYLCLYRWYQYRSNPQLSLVDDPAIEKIDSWLKHTITGDRSELGWLGEKSQLWSRVSARATNCLGGECPENAGCFISMLRKRAGSGRLLIVNHHVFFSDLALRRDGYGELMPRYEAVIFDEAHHIENVASVFFGRSFSNYQLLDLLSDVEQQANFDLDDREIKSVESLLSGIRQRSDDFIDVFPAKSGRYHLNGFIEEISAESWVEKVELLCSGLERVKKKVVDYKKYGDSWTNLSRRVDELESSLKDIATCDDQFATDYVTWYERRPRSVVLSQTPIEVASLLVEHLYSEVQTCILTSATLSSGGSFSYLQNRLGLDESARYLQLSSPFDYRNRTLIYVPESSFPEPAHKTYYPSLGERVLDLLYTSQGRALVLCTSFRGMDELAEVLQEKLDYPVLIQGSHSRNVLLRKFREETHSVLVAVASFWEGVDVVGDSLSCVVIEKLPFEVPSDPVIQSRIEKIKKEGGNPFFNFQVPRAVLTLRQGVGRLMRSSTDCGVVAIMDVRLFNKGYGKTFIKSLPPAPLTRSLSDVQSFFTAGRSYE